METPIFPRMHTFYVYFPRLHTFDLQNNSFSIKILVRHKKRKVPIFILLSRVIVKLPILYNKTF